MPRELQRLRYISAAARRPEAPDHRGEETRSESALFGIAEKGENEMMGIIGRVLSLIVGAVLIVAGYVLFIGGTAFVITAGIEMALKTF